MKLHLPRPAPVVEPASVSVVVPCFNYGRFLPQVVDSLLAQSDEAVGIDVLIVDDASTDGSATTARRLAEAHPSVGAICHDVNAGHIRTYNEGLAATEGEFVVLLSADDLLAPGSLRRAVDLLRARPSVGFVYGYSPYFRDVPPTSSRRLRTWRTWTGGEWMKLCAVRGRNLVGTPEVVMRRSIYEVAGGYRDDLPHSADFYLWMRAASLADVGRVDGPDQAYYRIHGDNMHLTKFDGVLTDLLERRRTFELLLTDPAVAGPLKDDLLAQARRSLATEAVRHAVRAVDARVPGTVPVAAYSTFAVETWPAIRASSSWRKLCARQSRNHEHLAGRGAARAREAAREVQDAVRWRRWRWSGT